jgi:hypothetical protein
VPPYPASVAQDPDLRPLRERREWADALPDLKGSVTRKAKVELRAEAKVRGVLSGGWHAT